MENTKKTAVIYARQSYGKEENSLSVEQQIGRCISWCERNGIEIKGIFKDNNTSSELYPVCGKAYALTDIGYQRWRRTRIFKGRREYRQGLSEAFEAIQQQHIDFFVVDETTRFYRNPSATSQLDTYCIVMLQEAKTALVNVTENKIDYLTSNIQIAMWRAFAQWEMEKVNEKAEASKRNRQANIQKGIVYSNAYCVDWKQKKIYFNTEKSAIIKYIFESVIQGKTFGEILYTLNTVFLNFADGKCFYETSIYNILKNPVYSGYRCLNDGRFIKIKNLGNEAIISFSMFKKANEIVRLKKEASGKQKYNVREEKRHFLPFSGLLKCGNCGSKLVMGTDKGIIYYCKHTHTLKDKNCTPSRIRFFFENDDEDFLVALQPLFLIRLHKFIYEARQVQTANIEKEKIEADIENLKNKQKIIVESFLSSTISEDVYKDSLQKIKSEIVEKSNQLVSLTAISDSETEKELARLNDLQQQIMFSEDIIGKDDYSRLVRETIKEIKVFKDYICISLFDGNSFNLPRIKGNRRSKKLPYATSYPTYTNGEMHYTIKFGDGKKEKILLKTENYKITLAEQRF